MYVLVWYKATLSLLNYNDGYYQIYGNVKYTKKYSKIPKIPTFKNDRGFASASKVCNEGCNEQSNEMMVTAEH